MHNVAPTRALARRSRQLLIVALVLGAIGALIAAIGVALFVVPLVAEGGESFGIYNFARNGLVILGGLIFVLGIGLAVRAVTWKTDNDLAQTVGRVLETQLDDRFTLIRNVSRRDIGYVDAVLVGPPGLLTFRILNQGGIFANDGADWLKQNQRGEWSPSGISPTRQVVADIHKLRDMLAQHNLVDVPVYGVIVFTREPSEVQLMAKNPVVPPTHLGSLIANLRDSYLAKDRIDAARIAATVRLLYQN